MKASKKIMFVLLFTLMAASAIGVFASAVNAQSATLNYQASVTNNNKGVGQEASYTFTITNTGSANLDSLNITVPIGFLDLRNLKIVNQPAGQNWNVTNQANSYILLSEPNQGLSTNQIVSFSFDAKNPPVAGTYRWSANSSTTTIITENSLIITSILPALAILGIAAGIAFLNSGLNRVLINYFIGWEQYSVMQKEMAEYRTETMAAARANDKKQMEKLKKKQSQINSMQSKMLKPQMVQFGISFVYLIVWFLVLTPTFGNTSMAYLPGFGAIPVFYLYPICSLFLGLISSRIIGIMPIEPR
jgi:uncharacterized membrane protein (DUF106 family)